MFHDCSWILLLGILVVMAESLTTGLMEDVSKADQAMRPKAKRVQELLMFGNQQNRRAENVPGVGSNTYTPNAEKRTLGTSGLEDVKAALAEDETFSHSKQPSNSMYEQASPYENNYQYGRVLSNEISPRNWDVPPYYPRYYSIGEEDRRKRSEKSTINQAITTTLPPSPSPSLATTQATSEPVAQAKRSIPIYQEPRYKRALDREEFLTLLSLWENSPRNRNWRNYGNDEYENVEDDSGVVGLDDEDSRNEGAWMVEPQRHFSTSVHGPQALSAFDIGIPRTHPVNSYDQYEQAQYATPYEATQYGGAQYGALYPSQSYYQPEKRYLVRKRSQSYDSYFGRNDLASISRLMGTQPQVYPNYPHRFIY